jgi:hypothetical protein
MSSPLRIWDPFTKAALDPPPLRVVRADAALTRVRCLLDLAFVSKGRNTLRPYRRS